MHSALVLRPSAHFRCCLEQATNHGHPAEASCGAPSPAPELTKGPLSLLLRFVSARYAMH